MILPRACVEAGSCGRAHSFTFSMSLSCTQAKMPCKRTYNPLLFLLLAGWPADQLKVKDYINEFPSLRVDFIDSKWSIKPIRTSLGSLTMVIFWPYIHYFLHSAESLLPTFHFAVGIQNLVAASKLIIEMEAYGVMSWRSCKAFIDHLSQG